MSTISVLLSDDERDFRQIVDEVIEDNRELYKRLSSCD
jgi:hypothetical protein